MALACNVAARTISMTNSQDKLIKPMAVLLDNSVVTFTFIVVRNIITTEVYHRMSTSIIKQY